MRDPILAEIRRLAKIGGGRPPGQTLFARESRIAQHQWRGKFWARWGDALVEAGYQPNDWTERFDSEAVIAGVIAACRHFGRIPAQSEIEIYRKSEPGTPNSQLIRRHFGNRAGLIAALAKRVAADPSCADIAAMLPAQQPVQAALIPKATATPEGSVYLIKSSD